MIHRGFVCLLLLSILAWGQATKSTSAAPPQQPAAPTGATPAAPEAKTSEAPPIPPDAPVITIQGVCAQPPADKTNAVDCKTVITRADFERLVDALAPNMPPYARRQLATRYATALTMAHKAHELGLDQGPKFEERLKAARISTLADLLSQNVQEKAAQVPDADVEDYYHKHSDAYEEADLQRLYIPHSKILEPSKLKLSDAETKKRQQDADETMKKEAEALHTRAAAGADFDKLQEEAFVAAGQKSKPPSTKMAKVRRGSLPPDQASAMDLKTGEVSALISSPSGYFVYKAGEKDTMPLDKVRAEIHGTLQNQRLMDAKQSLQQSSATVLDDKYFGAPEAAPPTMGMPPGGTMPPPGPKPPAKSPESGPK